jgi:hypothetical protein
MTTVKAFNEMMIHFLEDILVVFPDDLAIHIARAKPCEYQVFMQQVGPWASQLMTKDPAFFCEENEFAKSLYLHKHWYEEDCTDVSKAAIWQWLSSLYMIAMTLNMFPPEALSQIEAVAENCAKNMKGEMNESAMMAGMNSMLSSMLSGGGPLAGLMGGGLTPAALPPQTPRPKKKNNKKSR